MGRVANMYAVFSAANQAWIVLFGARVARASLVDIDGKRFWQSKRELGDALASKGLELDTNNHVVRVS